MKVSAIVVISPMNINTIEPATIIGWIVLFLLLQRHYVRGFLSGALWWGPGDPQMQLGPHGLVRAMRLASGPATLEFGEHSE